MATLQFSFGTMGSGKSTVALQIHHNLASRQLFGLLLTALDREGSQVTSRLGVAAPAIEVSPQTDLHSLAVARDSMPDVLEVTATSPDGLVMGLRHRQHPVEGIQFHPESILTTDGMAMLGTWLHSLRG